MGLQKITIFGQKELGLGRMMFVYCNISGSKFTIFFVQDRTLTESYFVPKNGKFLKIFKILTLFTTLKHFKRYVVKVFIQFVKIG